MFKSVVKMSCNYLTSRVDVKAAASDTLSEISETGTINSGWTSGWDSREDLQDLVAKIGLQDISDLHQERFRVDRKKLEHMLIGILFLMLSSILSFFENNNFKIFLYIFKDKSSFWNDLISFVGDNEAPEPADTFFHKVILVER